MPLMMRPAQRVRGDESVVPMGAGVRTVGDMVALRGAQRAHSAGAKHREYLAGGIAGQVAGCLLRDYGLLSRRVLLPQLVARSVTRRHTSRARAFGLGEWASTAEAAQYAMSSWHAANSRQSTIPIFRVETIDDKYLSMMAIRPTMKKGEAKPTDAAIPADRRFTRVVAAFANDRRVTYGGKGFGSSALKVDGKIFAMISSKGMFVVKLPKPRVEELVRGGHAKQFEAGRGRLMREWIELDGGSSSWVELAREASEFVGGGK